MAKLLVSMATENLLPYCGEIIQTHREYAEAQGYDYVCYQEKHPDFQDLHPVYSRLGFLLDAVNTPNVEKVIWADADVAFMDYTNDIGNLLNDNKVPIATLVPNAPLPEQAPYMEASPGYWLAGYDQNNWPTTYLCFGLLIFRANFGRWMVKAFLNEIARCCRENPDVDPAREQYYGYDVLAQVGFTGLRGCNQNEIGGFAHELWHDERWWVPGCPTVHLSTSGKGAWVRRQRVFHDIYLPQITRG